MEYVTHIIVLVVGIVIGFRFNTWLTWRRFQKLRTVGKLIIKPWSK